MKTKRFLCTIPKQTFQELHKSDKGTYYKGDAKTMKFDPRKCRTMQNIVVNA